ncbi:hypothetical protein AVEN_131604-1 [Araneus ventricosus]|uniref:Uncharacterized protein n=1 Tax=Araneus ventricosus TaxID=182803 RepID=A0A4Y2ESL1_ARAVE|nr:hypothetical protein AVEN_131604-1 [Araneus ventricosus]
MEKPGMNIRKPRLKVGKSCSLDIRSLAHIMANFGKSGEQPETPFLTNEVRVQYVGVRRPQVVLGAVRRQEVWRKALRWMGCEGMSNLYASGGLM